MKAEGRDVMNIDVGREKTITGEESEGMNILRTGKTTKEVREMRGDKKITRKIQGMMEVRKMKEMRNGGRLIRRKKQRDTITDEITEMEEKEEGKEEMPEMDEMSGTEGTAEIIETTGEVKDRREMGTERMRAKKRRKTKRGTTTGRITGKRMINVEMEGEMEIDLNEREVDVGTSKKVRMRNQHTKGGRKMSG